MREPIIIRGTEASEWPNSGLDIESLKAQGWRPTPFRQFILKIHSRCNLACDYCYMYEMTDQSWKGRPAAMSRATVVAAARRISEHATKHGLSTVQVVLHGGEPLLAGADLIDFIVKELHTALGAGVDLKLGMQTNGALLDELVLDLLLRYDIQVAVSLDGDKATNDQHRIYRNKLGSYEKVAEGIRRLTEERYRTLFSGLLTVIDTSFDPIVTFKHHMQFKPPRIDFLLPHATWAAPPPGRGEEESSTLYADWLIKAFDYWHLQGWRQADVRLFRNVIRLALSQPGNSEAVGLDPMTFLVIETDGSIEQVDTLKVAYPGAPETGLHVMTNDLDDAFEHPGVVARQIGAKALCRTCLECDIHTICGGGLYPHRYRPGSGFLNPSVYCADLTKFINHVSDHVNAELAKAKRSHDVSEHDNSR